MLDRKKYMKARAIIIGCGKIAGGHDTYNSSMIRTHAKAYKENHRTELIGVCDVDIDAAKKFANKWKVSYYTDSIDQLLDECRPDIVSICSDVNSHYEITKQVIKFGIKNIWLEKPATRNIKQLNLITKLASSHNTNVMVGYFRRHHKNINDLNNTFFKLGQIQHVNCYYTKGLENNGSHLLDLIINFFGDNFKITNVKKVQDKNYPLVSFEMINNLFKINVTALNYKYYETFEIDIYLTKGRVTISDGGRKITYYKVKKHKYYRNYFNLEAFKIVNLSYEKIFKNMLRNLLEKRNITTIDNEYNIKKLIMKINN